MRSEVLPKVEAARVTEGPMASDKSYGHNGVFIFKYKGAHLRVIASDGAGWDHVSVSCKNRCPKWDEMCYVKDLFWGPEETVIQFHPRRSEYVNNHPHTLHLWKNQRFDYQLPINLLV